MKIAEKTGLTDAQALENISLCINGAVKGGLFDSAEKATIAHNSFVHVRERIKEQEEAIQQLSMKIPASTGENQGNG